MNTFNCLFLFQWHEFMAGVEASLSSELYSAEEDSEFVEICIMLEGLTEREVTIQVFTADDSAKG